MPAPSTPVKDFLNDVAAHNGVGQVKKNWKEDWKEDAKKDWVADWKTQTPAHPVPPAALG